MPKKLDYLVKPRLNKSDCKPIEDKLAYKPKLNFDTTLNLINQNHAYGSPLHMSLSKLYFINKQATWGYQSHFIMYPKIIVHTDS